MSTTRTLAILLAAALWACGGGGDGDPGGTPDAREDAPLAEAFDPGGDPGPRDTAPDPRPDAPPADLSPADDGAGDAPPDAPDAADAPPDAPDLPACDALAVTEESCNGLDDDCDGDTDEDLVLGTCAMQWGQVICVGPRLCLDATPTCKAGPPADETCNGYDDDCDGDTDEAGTPGCIEVFLDEDRDGHGTGTSRCDCGFVAPWTARVGDDCDDSRPEVHPGAPETCDDRDNDCDGTVDPAGLPDCVTTHEDADGDLFGNPATALCLCPQDTGTRVQDATDCDDGREGVHPGAAEACNGLDDDCDGATDDGADRPGCGPWYADGDGDGWGGEAGPCLCRADGAFVTDRGGDCDDGSTALNPGVAESCNDVDDDCDGATDEDFDCDPGAEAVEACGFCGTRRRTCGDDCRWPEWSACEGSRTCEPGSLLPCPEGCGDRACTDACEWPEACTFRLDAQEPNDAQTAPFQMGYFDEEDDPPPARSGWIHAAGDADWYRFVADEEFPIFVDTDGSLVASATLTPGDGGFHRLCILWDDNADGGIDATRCTEGAGVLYAETPDVDPGLLDDAYGAVLVSVEGDPSCAPYGLTFYWD